MKKLILTITTILLFLTTSIISASAFSFFKKTKEPTLEDIKRVCSDVFFNYKYDENLGQLAQVTCNGTPKNIYECDVKFIEKYKGGICRQHTNLLIYKLKEIGVNAYNIVMGKSNAIHTATVYDYNGKRYVADRNLGYTPNIAFFNIPLEDYYKAFKDAEGYEDFYIMNPTLSDPTVEKLEL